MKLLLDTHTLYWFIEGNRQLSPQARTVVGDPANEILFSPASYWEMAIKISMGKWRLNRPYEEFLNVGLLQYGFSVLPIQPAHTAGLIGMPFHHKDPFDRLLVAQALVEQLPIVSADEQLEAYGVTRIW